MSHDGPQPRAPEAAGQRERTSRAGRGAAETAHRLERDTLVALVVSAAVAAAVGGWPMAGGVLGGGLLGAISYLPLKRAVDALAPRGPDQVPGQESADPPEPAAGSGTASTSRLVLGLVGRYALLLGAGYVIIGRLHLHPLGVLVGVSAVVVAAMAEAVRSWR